MTAAARRSAKEEEEEWRERVVKLLGGGRVRAANKKQGRPATARPPPCHPERKRGIFGSVDQRSLAALGMTQLTALP